MLLPDLPVTALARHEGLTEGLSDEDSALFALLRRCDPGCRHWVSQQEVPWRFRDARVAAVVPVLLRMAAPDLPALDALHERLSSEFRGESRLLQHAQTLLSLARQQEAPDAPSLARALLATRDGLALSIRQALSAHAILAPAAFNLAAVVRDPDNRVVQMTFLGGEDTVEVLAGPARARNWLLTRGALGFACGHSSASETVNRALLTWVARALAPRRTVR